MTLSPPQPLAKPKLAQWMFDRNIRPKQAATRLGVSDKQVRRYLLPFGDPNRQIPSEGIIAEVVDWTDGEIGAADFYPPELSGRPGRADVLAGARAE